MTPATMIQAPPAESIDLASVLQYFDGDLELLREVATIFLDDYPNRLAALHEALGHRDVEALGRAAHSIKGSVANFAATTAVRAALTVELLAREGDLAGAETASADLEAELADFVPILQRLLASPTSNASPAGCDLAAREI